MRILCDARIERHEWLQAVLKNEDFHSGGGQRAPGGAQTGDHHFERVPLPIGRGSAALRGNNEIGPVVANEAIKNLRVPCRACGPRPTLYGQLYLGEGASRFVVGEYSPVSRLGKDW